MSKSALVIGGTGPTGPTIVRGLVERHYDVTILHGGLHESTDVPPEVRHIHADPHFEDTLRPAVADESYDLVVAMYGRLRAIIDVFGGRTGRAVAVGAATGMAAAPDDPRWGRMGRPALLTEDRMVREEDVKQNKLAARMTQVQDALFEAHHLGKFTATYVGYPILYGPRQPGPQDWSIVRRILDGRRRMVIADGGLKLETRGYTANVAQAVLRVVDKPAESAGKNYMVCDANTYTMRQRIDFIASLFGHTFDYIDLPWKLARPCHPLWRYEPGHRLSDSALIRMDLGFEDELPADRALETSVRWLVDNPLVRGGEMESQLGDPFNYADEDTLIELAERSLVSLGAASYELPGFAHQYRHPKKPGEAWQSNRA